MNQINKKKVLGCGLSTVLWSIVILGGLILGFAYLMRSCLSQWDTYGFVGWPGISNDQKTMVICKTYSKTNSYSSKGGMTHISYSTTYYLEKIDIETGKVLQKKKLMNHRKIKTGGLQCYGGYDDKIWVFANYLRAYDMNSLEQVIKLEDIEANNPELKGKFPTESNYYDPHLNLGYITITAQDGDKYQLMLKDLKMVLIDPEANSYEKLNKQLENEYKKLNIRIDSMYAVQRESKDKDWQQLMAQRNIFYAQRDSIYKLQQNARDVFQDQQDVLQDLEDFNPWSSTDLNDWATAADTLFGFGFKLSKEEPNDDDFDLDHSNYLGAESDKVKLYRMTIVPNPDSHSRYDRLKVTETTSISNERFLQGGMLLDCKTAGMMRLKNPDGFIVVNRDVIGDKAKLIVTRMDKEGKKVWQTNALMSYKITFTTATDSHLIICGIIDQTKTPSFATADAVRIINLKTGELISVKY